MKKPPQWEAFLLADLLGEGPNHFDDLFKELANWEAILSSLPDFGVDQNRDEMRIFRSRN